MFCSRCGKRVLESMLFCPFCGSEIVIPEQDGDIEIETVPSVHPAEPEIEAVPEIAGTTQEKFSFELSDAPEADAAGEAVAEPVQTEPVQPEPEPEANAFDWLDASESALPKVDWPEETVTPAPEWTDAREAAPAETEEAQEQEDMFMEGADEGPRGAGKDAPEAEAVPEPPKPRKPRENPRDDRRRAEESKVPVLQRRRPEPAPERREDADGGGDKPGAQGKVFRNPVAARANRARRASTLAPSRPVSAEEMFMDDISDDYEDLDEFDAFEEELKPKRRPSRGRPRKALYDEDDEDEDDEDDDFEDQDDPDGKGSFFMRHIRSLVGIILFLVMIMLILLYALSDSGQTSLGRINATLPLRPEIYAQLGYQSYQAEDYRQAGVYYERALMRDPASYNYASSAAMSYNALKDTDKAVEMLKKCIEIDPTKVEPYIYLLNNYPDAASRPWEITQLIQQGYQRTGDSRLNVNG